jgi:hypothetical protein
MGQKAAGLRVRCGSKLGPRTATELGPFIPHSGLPVKVPA